MATTVSDDLLSEVERQQKYLAKLPENYEFPLFNARHALESQRRSGYRNTAAAAREIVDNALEAGASRVDVVFDVTREENRRAVAAVAFIDDGSGMIPQMIRYALSWGGGTHFEDANFIAKFGFGLPNSSINQARRVDVYSRTDKSQPFHRAYLDLDEFKEYGIQSIPAPEPATLPPFVKDYIRRNELRLERGTVVVWVRPDRLTYRRAANLKDHLVDDFGVVYRYLVGTTSATSKPFSLIVEGTEVEPIDPLFVTPEARYYVAPPDGAEIVEDRALPVAFVLDEDTGEKHLKLIREASGLDAVATEFSVINVKIVRFPYGFAIEKKVARGESDEANRRFEIRKTRRGMSFVRANREIETVDAFPRSQRDISSGLGKWPLLQSYAYHWGIEVRFDPSLDEVFGITNDKQSVRPIEDFWRVMAEAEIDAAARRENASQRDLRKKTPQPEEDDRPTPAELAAVAADVAVGPAPRVPEHRLQEAKTELAAFLKTRPGAPDEVRQAFERESRRRRYRIAYGEIPNGPAYEPKWVGNQMVVTINKLHPFYEDGYSTLFLLSGGDRAKYALDLLLLALGRGELITDDPEMQIWYSTQRRHQWSVFLEAAMKSLAQQIEVDEESVEATDDESELEE